MTLNPIRKVLSSMRKNGVQCLLMGGQACILYGGAEFSRDTDLAILAEPDNLARLQKTLADLKAERIAVPPFEQRYLDMGLAVHFRCYHKEAQNQRIDIMSKMRGVAPFVDLWSHRTTMEFGDEVIEVLGLPDLVQAKKTQRDKDWPMITRLLEAHYFQNRHNPNYAQIIFWLNELRTPSILIEVANQFRELAEQVIAKRNLLAAACAYDEAALTSSLKLEEESERAADRAYWAPLRQELERLRREARTKT